MKKVVYQKKESIFSSWQVWLLLIAVLFVIITIALRLATPNQSEDTSILTQQNPSGSITSFSDVSYHGETFENPKKLEVYQTTQTIYNKSEIEKALSSKFLLTQNPDFNYIWNGDTFSMTYDSLKQSYLLSKNQPSRYFSKYIDTKILLKILQKLLKPFFLITILSNSKQCCIWRKLSLSLWQ